MNDITAERCTLCNSNACNAAIPKKKAVTQPEAHVTFSKGIWKDFDSALLMYINVLMHVLLDCIFLPCLRVT